MNEQHETFQQWALVELFGHQQIAGLVNEQVIGGSSFIRVDVPDQGEMQGFTKFFGNGAIYSITPCTEDAARIAVARLQIRPISPWIVPDRKALPEPAPVRPAHDGEERGISYAPGDAPPGTLVEPGEPLYPDDEEDEDIENYPSGDADWQ